MTPIKHLLNNVLEVKSNKNNLKQGDVLNNKKRFMGFNKIEDLHVLNQLKLKDQKLQQNIIFWTLRMYL